ncbi:MAG: hypothetical protein QM535_18015 [Limnohabitans sp.]|nr:hypothetical protein [Limnohabitans sp.]
MIYTIEKANLLSKQLRRFTDGYAYMVAGQFANIDFWIEETINVLKALDEHKSRFEKMREAQDNWIEEKNVLIPNFCPICNGFCELEVHKYKKPDLPKETAEKKKKESRKELVDATYFFLIRCYKTELLSKVELENYCKRIGTSVDPYDLK